MLHEYRIVLVAWVRHLRGAGLLSGSPSLTASHPGYRHGTSKRCSALSPGLCQIMPATIFIYVSTPMHKQSTRPGTPMVLSSTLPVSSYLCSSRIYSPYSHPSGTVPYSRYKYDPPRPSLRSGPRATHWPSESSIWSRERSSNAQLILGAL